MGLIVREYERMAILFKKSCCRHSIPIILLVMGCLLVLAGCGVDPIRAERQTDQRVHQILDSNWDPDLGNLAKLTQTDPNEMDPEAVVLLETIRQAGTINLEQAIQLGMLNSHDYRTACEQLYLAGLNQADVQHFYTLHPFAGGIAGYHKEGSDEIAGGQATAGFNQLLSTGATLSSNFTLGYFDILTGDFRSGLTSIFHASVTQPLLRGGSRKVVMEPLTQAQRDTVYALRDFIRFRKSFCVSTATDYWQLAQLAWQAQNARANYEQLQRIYRSMLDLSQVGRLSRYELEQASQDVIKAETLLIGTINEYDNALDQFKVRLLIPQETELRIELQAPFIRALASNPSWPTDEKAAVELALQQRLDLASSEDRVDDARRQVEIAADALKADLAITGRLEPARHQNRAILDTDSSEIDPAQDRYELSLRSDLGLDRTWESHDYKRTIIALSQAERQDQLLREAISAGIRQAWRDMQEARERYELQKQAQTLANKRLENTSLLLQYRRASTRDVLDAQKDYLQAQNAYAAALADYATAELNFLRDTELLWIHADGEPEIRVGSRENPLSNQG